MKPDFVIKRNGKREPFLISRVERAIKKAFSASGKKLGKEKLTQLAEDVSFDAATAIDLTKRNPRTGKGDGHPPTLDARPTYTAGLGVELIQDLVEKRLMTAHHFAVAKQYILYREERRRLRELRHKEIINRADVGNLSLIKRNGLKDVLSMEKLQRTLERAAWDLPETLDLDELLEQTLREGYDSISTVDIEKTLIQVAVSFIERDPAYDKIAARLYLQYLYKRVFKRSIDAAELENCYKENFVNNIRYGVERKIFDPRLNDFNLDTLSAVIDPDADELFTYIGLQTLSERYFVRVDGVEIETAQAFWMRTAMGLAIGEDEPEKRAIEFYRLYSSLRFISSTPTLFHSGLRHPQLSSCYVSKVEDDLGHIFKVFGDNAQLAKWSGGIGNDWTAVRSTGASIASTRVESQGVIPFLKIANDTTLAINRSGKRRGATVAYLETWHLDIEDFLDLRRNTGDERRRTHDMNTANWIPDLFMKRVLSSAPWTLFSPDEVPDLHEIYGAAFEKKYLFYEEEARAGRLTHHREIDAQTLWRKMITRLFETGHPWITFKDPCNIRSPQDHIGVIHNSNLCTEITLNNSAEETAVCNLGSVNLARHVSSEGLDEDLLHDSINTAMRMLDNVIDLNFYPTKESRKSNLHHRPVALGMMGLQDVLFTLRMPFDSDEAAHFVDRLTETFSYHAIFSSSRLASERGSYESYAGSKWARGIFPIDTLDLLASERGLPLNLSRDSHLDWTDLREHVAQHGMRNSNTMAIAPTATISNIAGCTPCIEPIYKNLYVKANMSGEFTVVNKALVNDLKKLGLWGPAMLDQIKYHDGDITRIPAIPDELKKLYKEAFDVDPFALLSLTALRGKWIDQSQSHNVFIKGASGRKLDAIYTEAWRQGLKTTYYLRSLAASQIEKSTLDAKTYGYTQKRDQENFKEEILESKENPRKSTENLVSTIIAAPSTSSSATTNTVNPSLAEAAMPRGLVALIKKTANSRNTQYSENHKEESSSRVFPIESREKIRKEAVLVPASQVSNVCSLLDPECEACQ